mgnify:CR=1 FL=1
MNKYKIKETDVNMYEYRGYTISGNDRIGLHITLRGFLAKGL